MNPRYTLRSIKISFKKSPLRVWIVLQLRLNIWEMNTTAVGVIVSSCLTIFPFTFFSVDSLTKKSVTSLICFGFGVRVKLLQQCVWIRIGDIWTNHTEREADFVLSLSLGNVLLERKTNAFAVRISLRTFFPSRRVFDSPVRPFRQSFPAGCRGRSPGRNWTWMQSLRSNSCRTASGAAWGVHVVCKQIKLFRQFLILF